ncbi:hypothetical protein HPY86_02210 [candidate division WOR-3 bacterium]|nr:hypothetical protein [candidate division WOR-3 bacterium]
MILIGLLILFWALNKEEVINRIFLRQRQIASELAGVVYYADFTYQEYDFRSGKRQRIECRRRVKMERYEEQEYDFLQVSVDGRVVSGREKTQVCQNLVKKGLIARQTRMPFFLETRGGYRYEVLGTKVWQGESVALVKFIPRRADDYHIRGIGYVRLNSGDVVRLEFVPARLPFVVTDAKMVIDYGLVQGYWLPKEFRLKMDLRLNFLVEIMHRRIEIYDSYDDYQLNLRQPENSEG